MDDREKENGRFKEMNEDYPEREPTYRGPEHRYDFVFPSVSFAIFLSVFLGLHSTLPGGGIARNVLVLFVAMVAGSLSFVANKAAFHLGAILASSGDRAATALVIAWFSLMAVTVGTIGFAGVSHEIVEAANLREPGTHMADANRAVSEAAADGKQVLPLIAGGKSDVSDIAEREFRSGAVSGRAGPGPTVDRLRALAARFAAVEQAYVAADRPRAALIGKLETLTAKYEEQLNVGGAAGSNRAKLVAIYSQAQSLVTEIANVVPTAAARGLVSELRSTPTPTAIPGRIDVEAHLRGHADRLERALETVTTVKVALPPFPAPAGLMVGWQRLDLTLPLAVLLFGLEVILVVLWCLQVRDFKARRPSVRQRGIDTDPDDPPVGAALPDDGSDNDPIKPNGHDHSPPAGKGPRPPRPRHT
jgi:hypothetical protein